MEGRGFFLVTWGIVVCYLALVTLRSCLNPPVPFREEITQNWIERERDNLKEYNFRIDQAMADTKISGPVSDDPLGIIRYYMLYDPEDEDYVCRHRASRIVAEINYLNDTDEACIVVGKLVDLVGISFLPTDEDIGSGHAWVEYQGQEYDYLEQGVDFGERIKLARNCYTQWSTAPTLFYDNFDRLYDIYEEELNEHYGG